MSKPLSASSRMTLDKAAKFIADRDMRAGDDARLAIDRTRKRIVSATRRGELARGSDGTFSFGDLIGWALRAWKNGSDLFNGMPANIAIYPKSINGSGDVGQPKVTANLHPRSLAACHLEIDRLVEEVVKRDIRVSDLEVRIGGLEPDAEKTRHRRSKAKEAADKRWHVEK